VLKDYSWKISISGAARCSRRLGLTALLLPAALSAHVKWFCFYDVTKPTKPLLAVINANFLSVLGVFVALLFLVFCVDDWVAKRWPRFESQNSAFADAQEKLVRLGVGAFFLCTWNIGLNILTPELHTQSAWMFVVQFVTAMATAWKRTCIGAALGIGVLYAYGVSQYGFFHMLDYVYFLGLAAYLAFTSLPSQRLLQLRTPVMTACLAFSLMWTAIEKLLYPQWSQQLMTKHGHMMMGMKFDIFIVIAAFVEFTLSFYLATGRGMLRLGALALLIVFVSAMPEFGPVDVVGHFPLIAILGVPFLAGDSSLQRFWRLPQFGTAVNAAATCVLYIVTLAVLLSLYHGVQWLEYHSSS
jgi:hypothetical protein